MFLFCSIYFLAFYVLFSIHYQKSRPQKIEFAFEVRVASQAVSHRRRAAWFGPSLSCLPEPSLAQAGGWRRKAGRTLPFGGSCLLSAWPFWSWFISADVVRPNDRHPPGRRRCLPGRAAPRRGQCRRAVERVPRPSAEGRPENFISLSAIRIGLPALLAICNSGSGSHAPSLDLTVDQLRTPIPTTTSARSRPPGSVQE